MVSDPHPHTLVPVETPGPPHHEIERTLKEKEQERDEMLPSQGEARKSESVESPRAGHQRRDYLGPAERVEDPEDRYRRLKGKNHHLKKQYDEHRDRCYARARDSETQYSGLQRQYNDLQLRYESLQLQYNQASHLLETRGTELRAAQNFLSTEDSRSVEDVMQLVHDLNSEIVQASAALVESLTLEPTIHPSDSARQAAGQNVSELIGPLAAKLLCSFRGADDIDVLEVIFRGCMAAWAHKIIGAWHLGPGDTGDLPELYDTICSAEEQAVAGRWRALTRRNIQRRVHSGLDMFKSTSPHIVNSLVDATICAGLSSEHDSARNMVMKGLGNKLLSVTEMSHTLNKVLGEDVTSSDMQVTSVKGGGKYAKSSMETHDGRDDADWDGKGVICTADLGLKMQFKVNGMQRYSILFRHKVAIEGFMD